MKHKIIISAVMALFLSGCGGSDDNNVTNTGPLPAEPLTPAEIITDMEKRGQLPVLERTASISGVDQNNNNIRDDIDQYIAKEYPNVPQQKAVQQLALHLQHGLEVDKTDLIQVKKISFEKSRAIGCIYEKFPHASTPAPKDVAKDLIAVTTNTKERLLAYLAFSKALDGTVLTLAEGDLCDE